MFVEFVGASYETIDDERSYSPMNRIFVNPDQIAAYYDHTILTTSGNKIRVMETTDEISNRLLNAGAKVKVIV